MIDLFFLRVMMLILPVLGFALGVWVLWEYYREKDTVFPRLNLSQLGIVFILVAYVFLFIYYAIDPGFVNARQVI
jgi:hypothetical protein